MSHLCRFTFAVCTFSLLLTAVVTADSTDASSGLQAGDPIGAFYVTKAAGAVDDSVEVGQSLCYRCRYGSSPMVMVFARETAGDVPALLKALDKAVAEHEDARLKGLLTLLGEDAAALKQDAEKIAAKASAQLVPVVVAKETQTGPESYQISADDDVTVILAKDSQVVSAHTFAANNIDVQAVIQSATAMLED